MKIKAEGSGGPCKKSVYIFFSTLFFLAAVGFGVYVEEHHCESNVRFVNKDFVCHKKMVVGKKGYAKLQSEIEEFIVGEKERGTIEHASVYFRDLVDGPIFAIDEYEYFAPASLLKLPVALVYMVLAEKNPAILSELILFKKPAQNLVREFGQNGLESNVSYSVEELLSSMLVHSDNGAYLALYKHLTKEFGDKIIYDTYLELGILEPKDMYDEIITVRRYASIFRGLYSVSLVNQELSEKLLSWLAQSVFTGGLESSVPGHVRVAHKFGERGLKDGKKQFHDCGIVYYPDNPYLICIMTQGREFEDLVRVLSHISKLVYQEFDSRRL